MSMCVCVCMRVCMYDRKKESQSSSCSLLLREAKDLFFQDLQGAISSIPSDVSYILLGDVNARTFAGTP